MCEVGAPNTYTPTSITLTVFLYNIFFWCCMKCNAKKKKKLFILRGFGAVHARTYSDKCHVSTDENRPPHGACYVLYICWEC